MARQIGAKSLKHTSALAVTLRDKYCCYQAYRTNEAQGHLVTLVAGRNTCILNSSELALDS